ncbi:hypothetical protein XENOCAPTIV_020675, partial [Xenoophorus captivus]
VSKPDEGNGILDSALPCPEDYAQFCEHGQCEMRHNLPTCRCEAAYGGPQCDQLLDFNILYVVPSGQKLHYVLIAAIIGAVQIAVIVAVVMCFTRYAHLLQVQCKLSVTMSTFLSNWCSFHELDLVSQSLRRSTICQPAEDS